MDLHCSGTGWGGQGTLMEAENASRLFSTQAPAILQGVKFSFT
jgi:hypothetical protein